jgi:hypothetical protein
MESRPAADFSPYLKNKSMLGVVGDTYYSMPPAVSLGIKGGLSVLGGVGSAVDAKEAYDEYKANRPFHSAVKGLAALGGASMMVPTPLTEAAGALMTVPSMALHEYDVYSGQDPMTDKNGNPILDANGQPRYYPRPEPTMYQQIGK